MTARSRPTECGSAEHPPVPAAAADGFAPQGMWWVAWRQHRLVLLVALGLLALLAAAMVVFRMVLSARVSALTGSSQGCAGIPGEPPCTNPVLLELGIDNWRSWSKMLLTGMAAGPVVIGVLAGVAVFAREFERGTAVFALSQSVRRSRWFATKLLLVGVPLVLAASAVSLLAPWFGEPFSELSNDPIGSLGFVTGPVVVGGFTAMSVALGAACGTVLRSVLPALLVAGLLAAGISFGVGVEAKPHLWPTQRYAQAITFDAQGEQSDLNFSPDGLILDSGYLNADRQVVDYPVDECPYGGGTSPQPGYGACLSRYLHYWYIDYLPESDVWPLRGVVGSTSLLVAVLALGAGWRGVGRLRPRR